MVRRVGNALIRGSSYHRKKGEKKKITLVVFSLSMAFASLTRALSIGS